MQKRKVKEKTGRWTKEPFSDHLDRLFNILHCRCPFIACEAAKCITGNCTAAHISCSCPLKTKEFGKTGLRPFKVPKLNWLASKIEDLIDWDSASESILNAKLCYKKDEI